MIIHSHWWTTLLPSQPVILEPTKTKSALGPDKLPGSSIRSRSSQRGASVVGTCDQQIASKRGTAIIDRRSVIKAGQLRRQRAGLLADEIHVSTPATIATIAAAIGASSFTLMTASAVTTDGIIRC